MKQISEFIPFVPMTLFFADDMFFLPYWKMMITNVYAINHPQLYDIKRLRVLGESIF